MNVALINPFVLAIHHVFDTMVHVPVKLGKPCLKSPNEASFIVSATIFLSGSVKGSVSLRLTSRAALALASSLVGTPCTVLDDDSLDAIGEVANIVTGNAKKDLSQQSADITVPKVHIGPPAKKSGSAPTIVIPCETEVGHFALEVSIEETPKAAPAATPEAA